MSDAAHGVWETTLLLDPEQIAEDRSSMLKVLNVLEDSSISLIGGTFVLSSGRTWTYRSLGAAVVV
jgi:hypothetical protein